MTRIRPIPASLSDTLRDLTDEIDEDSLAYKVARLVEQAYGEGYADGHLRGHTETYSRQWTKQRRSVVPSEDTTGDRPAVTREQAEQAARDLHAWNIDGALPVRFVIHDVAPRVDGSGDPYEVLVERVLRAAGIEVL